MRLSDGEIAGIAIGAGVALILMISSFYLRHKMLQFFCFPCLLCGCCLYCQRTCCAQNRVDDEAPRRDETLTGRSSQHRRDFFTSRNDIDVFDVSSEKRGLYDVP